MFTLSAEHNAVVFSAVQLVFGQFYGRYAYKWMVKIIDDDVMVHRINIQAPH
ncbi:hypothetical protein VCRA2122O339_240076 [Vibrio crassostreae]|nr:hypothetical protein VCRA2120E331_250017 [Vibrio crassostreae]CAK3365726.1 hypothetical protein VCRA2120E330_240016 [Vibrio crassostreae]CAK3365843.1 hypothetical protein VCRA2127O345_250075 [Vibrio crassostreae]CAK3384952.1 hypothetical protein VCRA2122O339_240076 [Vibrio crassostreae]CAK3396559.1 hypothetical protein VCRA2122O338_250017 [Vibrio crassostreae]